MRTAAEIYEAYRINPGLQLHQLRVAAVAKQICGAFMDPLNVKDIVETSLFHDMGNIIKSDLGHFPDSFWAPYPPEYWKQVQHEFLEKYGSNEHHATIAIAREIGLSEHILDIIDAMRFSRTVWIKEEAPMEYKIAKYADLRVGPYGVLSLEDRLEEARVRYAGRESFDTGDILTPENLARSEAACGEIERQIFDRCSIKPDDINDASVASLIEELRDYQIK